MMDADIEYRPKRHSKYLHSMAGGNVQTNEYDPLLSKEESEHVTESGAGSLQTLFLMVNSILGSGILGLAFACREFGIIPYSIFICVCGACAYYTIHLLLSCCTIANATSYEGIAFAAYGKRGQIVASSFIWVQNIGQIISYMVIIGEILPGIMTALLPSALHSSLWANRRFLMILVVVGIVLPLTYLKRIKLLSYSSIFAVSCMLLFVTLVVVKQHTIPCPVPFIPFREAPTMVFSYVSHPTILPLYTELRNRTQRKMERIAIFGTIMCTIVYLFVAIFGYISFRGGTMGDLLKMYSLSSISEDIVVIILQIGVTISVIFIIPVIHYSTRKTVDLTFFPEASFNWFRHCFIATVLVGIALCVSLFVPTITIVFGLVGATSGMAVVYVIPCVLYLKLNSREYLYTSKGTKWSNIGIYLLIITTVLLGLISSAGIIRDMVTGLSTN